MAKLKLRGGPDPLTISFSQMGERNHGRHTIELGCKVDDSTAIIRGFVNTVHRCPEEGEVILEGKTFPDLKIFKYEYNLFLHTGEIETAE